MPNQIEASIEIIFHATEDARKIFEPLLEIFQIREEEFSVEKIEGHYGNAILLFRTVLSKKRAEEFVKKLVSKISQVQINEVLDNIGIYFEGSALFLRIGKGEFVGGTVSLQQNNAIKIKIKVPIYKKDEIASTYAELLRA